MRLFKWQRQNLAGEIIGLKMAYSCLRFQWLKEVDILKNIINIKDGEIQDLRDIIKSYDK